MYLKSGNYHIADEVGIGLNLHWLRACVGEDIDSCAQKLGVDIDTIDKIERGLFSDPQISLNLLMRYAALFNERLVLTVRCMHGLY